MFYVYILVRLSCKPDLFSDEIPHLNKGLSLYVYAYVYTDLLLQTFDKEISCKTSEKTTHHSV